MHGEESNQRFQEELFCCKFFMATALPPAAMIMYPMPAVVAKGTLFYKDQS